MLNTPILFLIFNRPDTTALVFNSIRKIKPTKLYIAADGARNNVKGEKEICNEVRSILDEIDWNCEVKTLFREKNLGCKIAVSSAIDWFFENEEQGIILEDDCLPQDSFYYYCEELLNYYKNDINIMHIGGANFQKGIKRGDGSYYFSNYNHVWGWATWRRAWQSYDVELKNYSIDNCINLLKSVFESNKEIKYWSSIFKNVYDGKISTWDYQWTYSIWQNGGISILPNVNLIKNIGINSNGTHTKSIDILGLGQIDLGEISSIEHPKTKIVDKKADRFGLDNYFNPSLLFYFVQKIKYKLGSNRIEKNDT